MKHPYSTDALEIRLGLEAGVVEPSEVIVWADRILEIHDYNDDVANVALATNASRKEMISVLAPLIGPGEEWGAARKTLGRMHQALLDDPSRAHDFTRFLESFWIRHGYNVPADMSFMAGIEDEFQLAEDDVHGTIEDATQSLAEALARFNGKK